jgi:uncharacterized protein YuzB (UPF0349 family)
VLADFKHKVHATLTLYCRLFMVGMQHCQQLPSQYLIRTSLLTMLCLAFCCCCAGALEAPLGNAVAGRSTSVGAHLQQQQQQLDAAADISPTASVSLSVTDGVTDIVSNTPDNTNGAGLSSLDSEQQLVQHAANPTSPTRAALVGSSIGNSHWQQQQQQMGPQLSLPMPAVTMVFVVVEGAKVFGKGRRQLVKEVHAHLSQLLMEALKHVRGGYLCRMQVRHTLYVPWSASCSALAAQAFVCRCMRCGGCAAYCLRG